MKVVALPYHTSFPPLQYICTTRAFFWHLDVPTSAVFRTVSSVANTRVILDYGSERDGSSVGEENERATTWGCGRVEEEYVEWDEVGSRIDEEGSDEMVDSVKAGVGVGGMERIMYMHNYR